MKLYLSSFRLGEQKQRLAEMAASERIAFIPNALDGKDGVLREKIIKRFGFMLPPHYGDSAKGTWMIAAFRNFKISRMRG